MEVGNNLLKLSMDGELLSKSADSFIKLMPGRKIVSVARATRKTEQIFTECINDLVREAEDNNWSEELLAWRVQSAAESFGKRMNLEEVVRRSAKHLDYDKSFEEKTVDAIDSEWMTALVEHAESTTDENMRDIVAAILAGEVNRPGSYSKGAVTTLARMDAGQVHLFEKLCRYVVYPCYSTDTGLVPFYDDPVLVLNKVKNGGGYAGGAVTYRELMEAEALGLISTISNHNFTLLESVAMVFFVGNECAFFSCDGEQKLSFDIALTKTGSELSRLFEDRDHDVLHDQLNQKAKEGSFLINWCFCNDLEWAFGADDVQV